MRTLTGMRWERLFDDLEGQAQAWDSAELESEILDRTRGELGQLLLVNRLRAAVGTQVQLQVAGAGPVTGILTRLGSDWLMLAGSADVVVPLAAVSVVDNLGSEAVSPAGVGRVDARAPLTAALRAIAVDRCPVQITLRDGSHLTGTPARVGRDFVDLTSHDVGDRPRASAVRGRATVSFAALATVRRLEADWR